MNRPTLIEHIRKFNQWLIEKPSRLIIFGLAASIIQSIIREYLRG